LELLPGRGEWFTFYENLIRRDYLVGLQLGAGDVVVDIGANLGAFTVLAAKRVGPAGRVYAYEPDPVTCARLEGNVRLNGLEKVVVVENAAVGAAAGEAVFYRYAKHAFSSLIDGVAGRVQQHQESFPVRVVGIREVVAKAGGVIKLMKVDCEGSEYDLMDALDAETARGIEQIAMEVHPVEGKSSDAMAGRIEGWGMRVERRGLLVAKRGK
jgi:FkbM family methyltransferase